MRHQIILLHIFILCIYRAAAKSNDGSKPNPFNPLTFGRNNGRAGRIEDDSITIVFDRTFRNEDVKDGKNYFTKKALSNGLKQGKPNGSSHIRNLIEGWSSKLRDGAKRAIIWTLRSLLGEGFVEAPPPRVSGKDKK